MTSDEKILLKKAIKGDITSFETLIKRYQSRAYNIAFRILGNEEDAKDAVQDSFIKIYRSLQKFKGNSSFYTWIYRIVTNTCYDFIKKRKKIQKNVSSLTQYNHFLEGEIQDIKDELYEPEKIIDQKEETNNIIRCLNKLTLDHKIIIILRDVQGFSYEEISQILNCSEGTVKSRINRARHKLKEIVASSMEQI